MAAAKLDEATTARDAAAVAATAEEREARLVEANEALAVAIDAMVVQRDMEAMTQIVPFKTVVELRRNWQVAQLAFLQTLSGFAPEQRAQLGFTGMPRSGGSSSAGAAAAAAPPGMVALPHMQ